MDVENLYNESMFNSSFGLERETLRIGRDGFVSRHKHPFENDPNIEKDFCENQIEIISPICNSIEQLYASIDSIDRRVRSRLLNLGTGEYLWLFSNPPFISEDGIQVASYQDSTKDKEIYREYLSEKYGKYQMLFCGVHFNFSHSETFLKRSFEKSGSTDFIQFKNAVYLDLAKKVYSYSWLIVYLTAASPVCDNSLKKHGKKGLYDYKGDASPRNSMGGYWNTFVPILDFSDISCYTESIDNYIKRGQLHSVSECYIPVRVKPKGENTLDNLESMGINHIELRMLDLNPLSRLGIMKEDLHFLYLFLLYLTCMPSGSFEEFDKRAQENAVMNHKNAAKFDCGGILVNGTSLITAGKTVLEDMERFYAGLKKSEEVLLISEIKQRLLCPEQRYAQKVYDLFQDNYLEKGLRLAKYYSEKDAADLWIKGEI